MSYHSYNPSFIGLLLILALIAPGLLLAQVDTSAELEADLETSVETRDADQLQNRQNNLIQLRSDRNSSIEARSEARTETRLQRQNNIQNNLGDRQAQQDARQLNRQDLSQQRQQNRQNGAEARRERRAERLAERRVAREERQATIRQDLITRLNLTQQQRAENRAQFNADQIQRVENSAAQLASAYLAKLERAENIFAQLQTRLEVQADQGQDIESTTLLLNQAQELLTSAENSAATATVNAELMLEADQTALVWVEAQEQFSEAKATLQQLKPIYREALAELKRNEVSINAEVSGEVNNQIN
jgi:hypothetical protein